MSTKNQAKYSDQFKAEAAAMVIELGKSQVVVCRELGVSKSALSKWVADARGIVPTVRHSQPGEVADLEREVKKLRQENEFLKKAAAFFARESE